MSKRQELRTQRRKQQDRQRYLWYGLIGLAIVAVLALLIIPALTPPPDTSGLTRGSADAPVKVTVFSDFQCPACKVFHDQYTPDLIDSNVDAGLVQFTYTPVAFIGPESIDAAKAAFCANEQGKFWEYHGVLFANHTGENVGDFTEENLVTFAEGLDLDSTSFQSCLNSQKYANQIQDNMTTWSTSGLNTTPSFLVNGQPTLFEGLEGALNAALGQ